MNVFSKFFLVLASLVGSLALADLGNTTGGGTLPLGLSWDRGVFVQELWTEGHPYYRLSNLDDNAHRLKIEERSWELAPHSSQVVDGQPLVGEPTVHSVYLDGEKWGLLYSPHAFTPTSGARYAIAGNLNTGGMIDAFRWLETDSLQVRAGEVFTVRLQVKPGQGTIKLYHTPRIDKLPSARPVAVHSETLPVKETNEGFEIDLAHPLRAADLHTLVLEWQAPQVAVPSLAVLDGSHTWATGGYGFAYALEVLP